MTFSAPLALILLVALPYFVWYGRPRTPFRRGRDVFSLALRLLIASLLVFSIAGTQLVLAADRLATIFLVDYSDSMGAEGRQAALDYVEAALDSMGPDDQAGVILFGADALVERPLSNARTLDAVRSTPRTLNTNLAEAIRLALALFPPDMARRVVVLSDGLATVGDAEAAARLAAASGVQIDYVSFQRAQTPEVIVTNVHTPATLDEGQIFDLSLTLDSNFDGEANITVLAGGEIVHQEPVALRAGTQSFVLSLQAGESGFTDFRVVVEPLGADTFYQNNALSSFSRITGPPRVLLVRNDPQESAELVRALTATGVTVDEIEPGGLPTGLGPLSVYESVVLVNVPATDLPLRRMNVLQVYVRDLGGGLVVIGGPNSYGVGGYYQTPLEETLPVEMRIRDQERLPELALVFVIDRSGSMSATEPSGYTHLDLAKEAVIRSVDLLNSTDNVGVVGFDSSAFWVVPLQQVSNPGAIKAQVGTMTPGGGTSIFAAVEAVAGALPQHPAPIKHVILLSDGGANPAGVLEIVHGMYQEAAVTTSVVAIGANYTPWIENLARDTGGRFHFTPDVATVPTIFTAETILASRSYIVEETFFPAQKAPSPIMAGITQTPALLGYVATSAKDTARVILGSDQEDPILATWQYGLGRAVAWTSDARARWSADWVNWDEFARFWSQAVRWTITEGADEAIEVTVERHDDRAIVRVDALDRQERYLNGLDLSAHVVAPDLAAETVTLRQVAPGRYEGTFVPTEEGAYFVGVSGAMGAEGEPSDIVQQTTGWVLSYSPEYRNLEADPRALERIARLTEGRQLTNPGQAFDHNLVARRAPTPLWPWLLLVAALLLPLDVAARRLIITRTDVERAREAVARFFSRGGVVAVGEEHSGRFDQLRDAKERAAASTRAPDAAAPPEVEEARRERLPRPEYPRPSAPPATPAYRVRRDAPPAAPPEAAPDAGEEAAEGTLAARLLKRRRARDDDGDSGADSGAQSP
ncbi:MAG: VWA domain-containing protein [Anaerolineae bacterium]|nr:VWA domain-containing protein [Anaerolineae bacterium]